MDSLSYFYQNQLIYLSFLISSSNIIHTLSSMYSPNSLYYDFPSPLNFINYEPSHHITLLVNPSILILPLSSSHTHKTNSLYHSNPSYSPPNMVLYSHKIYPFNLSHSIKATSLNNAPPNSP